MSQRSASPASGDDAGRVLDGGFWLVLVLAVVCGALVILSLIRGIGSTSPGAGTTSPAPSPEASVDVSAFLGGAVVAAPPIELTDQDGARVLAGLAARLPGLRLLRVHALPGRVPGDDRRGR